MSAASPVAWLKAPLTLSRPASASAPEEVVAEARENLALREEEEAKIKDALARLQEIG